LGMAGFSTILDAASTTPGAGLLAKSVEQDG
jgi:hypothetical protein